MDITARNLPVNKEEFAAIMLAASYVKHNKDETIEAYTKRILMEVANNKRYIKLLAQSATESKVEMTPDALDVFSCIKFEEPKQTRDFTDLAQKMMDLFPIGKKPGTSYLWRGNLPMITLRLKQLWERAKADFTDEEALEATKAYVADHANDQSYMRVLKFFIFKNQSNGFGNEFDSDLLSWIDNIRNGGTTQQQITKEEQELFY